MAPTLENTRPGKRKYSACSLCGKLLCLCDINDIEAQRYRQNVHVNTFLAINEIVARAKEFALKDEFVIASRIGRITSLEVNPGLRRGCMALQRYCQAATNLSLQDLKEDNTIFAWHGTTYNAIPLICSEGFNPTLRSRQVYGIGEYFGKTAPISLQYDQGTNRLIVTQIIRCRYVSMHNNCLYVVNNPQDWSFAFNLPVLVFSFESTLPPPIQWIIEEKRSIPPPLKPRAEHKKPKTSGTTCRWYWTNDAGDSQSYTDHLNDAIEKHYRRFFHNSGPSTYDLPPTICQCGNVNCSTKYRIDFTGKTQTNLKTGFVRIISRRSENGSTKMEVGSGCNTNANVHVTMPAISTGINGASRSTTSAGNVVQTNANLLNVRSIPTALNPHWYWQKDDCTLEPYQDSINDFIESNYQRYHRQGGPAVFDTLPVARLIDNTAQVYRIDVVAKTQTNLKTGFVRKIQRKPRSRARKGSSAASGSVAASSSASPTWSNASASVTPLNNARASVAAPSNAGASVAAPSSASASVAPLNNARASVAAPSNASASVAAPSNASASVAALSNASASLAAPDTGSFWWTDISGNVAAPKILLDEAISTVKKISNAIVSVTPPSSVSVKVTAPSIVGTNAPAPNAGSFWWPNVSGKAAAPNILLDETASTIDKTSIATANATPASSVRACATAPGTGSASVVTPSTSTRSFWWSNISGNVTAPSILLDETRSSSISPSEVNASVTPLSNASASVAPLSTSGISAAALSNGIASAIALSTGSANVSAPNTRSSWWSNISVNVAAPSSLLGDTMSTINKISELFNKW